MADSMNEYLRQDLSCDHLLECIYGLKDLDREVFGTIVSSDEHLTVDEIADAVDRERSTAYRSVQRLVQTGFVQKEQINYDDGGYYHVFTASDPDMVADEMQRLLNDWYSKIGQLIQEFRDQYSYKDDQAAIQNA